MTAQTRSSAPAINIGIDDEARKRIADGLSRLLADSYSLYLKTHYYHWNVTGPRFRDLHLLFEEQYTELATAVDDVAERIRTLGYQAPGTLGSIIRGGAKDVRIHGREVKVRAQIRALGNYSAHADQAELLDWIFERCPVPGSIFLNHGEDDARGELKRMIAQRGVDESKIFTPTLDETFELKAGTPASKGRGPARLNMTQVTEDWQNKHAALLLSLSQRLEATDDPEEKASILGTLEDALGA